MIRATQLQNHGAIFGADQVHAILAYLGKPVLIGDMRARDQLWRSAHDYKSPIFALSRCISRRAATNA